VPQTNPPSAATQPSEPWQVPLLQQACPAAPHAVHIPAMQLAPLPVQVVPTPPSARPPQQACPIAPQGVPEAVVQLPLLQVPEMFVPVQASPEPTH
jgi:hypothetical protein